ncbi:MAG: threonylcarbamoyl-AMP synthase, partial [Planctomycetes bacterium]|nr:threonylcarbamoyl-AMP synthase [Planctomycetota bacterium]
MPEPARFDLTRDDGAAALAAALAALGRGELVVVPTETVYGVAAR